METNYPSFSIIIPCFNHGLYLQDCLKSVQQQSFSDWEAIVVNDGSTDNSGYLANQWGMNDPRIKVIHQLNKGLSASRNSGIGVAKGKFLVFLDADDWLYPGFLKMAKEELIPSVSVVVTGYSHWKDFKSLHEVSRSRKILGINDFLYGNYAPPAAFVIKKMLVEQIGFFDDTLKSAEDWDFWIRAAKCEAQILSIPQVLAVYRYSEQSMSRDGNRMYQSLKKVFLRIPELDPRITSLNQLTPKELDVSKGILKLLMPCVGLLIIQGKIDQAKTLFLLEKDEFDLQISIQDFAEINSYLTFRYWNSKADLEKIIKDFKPKVGRFLYQLDYSKSESIKMESEIFKPTIKKLNKIKYGNLLGTMLNKFIG